MSKFLDLDGLEYFADKIKEPLSTILNNNPKNILNCTMRNLRSLNTYGTWENTKYIVGGITYTVRNSQYQTSITVNGTNSTATSFQFYINLDSSLNNNYVLAGGTNTIPLTIAKQTADYNTYVSSTDDNGVVVNNIPSGVQARVVISVPANTSVSNITINPILCKKELWNISHTITKYQPSFIDYFSTGFKLVYNMISDTSKNISYGISMNDFDVNASACGNYLILVTSWSGTPTISAYMVSYSGGNLEYTNVTKIAGADLTITATNKTISFTTAGKILIYAIG